MKTKLLLSVIIMITGIQTLFATHNQSALNIRTYNDQPILVTIDGRNLNGQHISHHIGGLNSGMHNIEIYLVSGFNNWAPLLYHGNINLPEGREVNAVVDRSRRLVISTMTALQTNPQFPVTPIAPDLPGHPGYPGFIANACAQDAWQHSNNPYTPPYMDQASFEDLLRIIKNRSFESSRKQVALGALRSNYFTSAQIRHLLDVFWFESTKVEIAKAAYSRVVDQGNYYLVYDAFTFESSISELQASIL